MKAILGLAMTTAMAFGAAVSNADEPVNKLTMTQKHQMMKDCMARQKMLNDGKSSADMKQACMDEMNKPKDPTEHIASGAPDKP